MTRLAACDTLIVGISGARHSAAAPAALNGDLVAACEQERVTRIRSVPLESGRLPEEALAAVLRAIGRGRDDIQLFVAAEPDVRFEADLPHVQIDHHQGHAATAALSSGFSSAAVLVCDSTPDCPLSVWSFESGCLTNCGWPAGTAGLASV